jgi:lipid biosynthesis B12-binding/radical SAM protein
MSRIFLVSSNTIIDPYPVYPVGMAIIASALTRAGHEVCQFDFLAEEQSEARLRKVIKDFAPHYVGISIRNIDAADHCLAGHDWYLSTDLGLMKIIRETTAAPVILGGSGFSVMPNEILNYLGGNYGVIGEGEQAVCDLIEGLDEGRAVPVITVQKAAFGSGDAITCQPLWDHALVNFYTGRSGMISMQTKRGCPYKCAYCTYPVIEGDRVRQRPPDAIADEVEKLQKTYGINTFYFTDSIFNDGENGYLNVAETLVRREIQIRWAAFFRPDKISKENLALLKQSGLYAIEAGTDAASDETLSGLNKHLTFDDVNEFNRACVDAKIPCAHYVIFGGPGETVATVKKGLSNMEMLKNCIVFAFSGIRIFPGTMIQARAIE